MNKLLTSPRQSQSQSRMPQHQRGGTMLGFIIGGVVGLLVALIVAVYVTKVPVPFVNKAVNRNAEQDAAEVIKNKNWDPNAPLVNKAGGKAVEGAVTPASSAAASSNPASSNAAAAPPVAHIAVVTASTAAAMVPSYVASKAAEAAGKSSKPSADPLGDLMKAKVAGAAASAPPVSSQKEGDAFFVQAGAYTNADDAEAQKAKISLNGLEAKVTEREVNGRTVYRVRVGPIDKKPDADKTRERLESLGYDARVMTVSR